MPHVVLREQLPTSGPPTPTPGLHRQLASGAPTPTQALYASSRSLHAAGGSAPCCVHMKSLRWSTQHVMSASASSTQSSGALRWFRQSSEQFERSEQSIWTRCEQSRSHVCASG